ncbi:MAG: glycosyltransferase [Sulfurovum sp.]|nr:glycosyltransferase [Sulfurovum sp.]
MLNLISIAMCTYNGERFIEEQIDSILNQSYANFELIITDDGSSDNTIEIIKKYLEHDKRIKLYQNENNLGFVKNFEKAISLCSGNYIALADQDDSWKQNKLEVFIEKIEDNVLIYSDALLIDEYSIETGKELIRPDKNLVSGSNNRAFLLENCVSGNTLMFKRELLEHLIPIPSDISFHDIWITFVASTYGSIIYTDESMTYYRRYSEQITKTREKDYEGFFDRFEKKKNIRQDNANVVVKDLENFLSLSIVTNKETKHIIHMLLEHFRLYGKIYYNFSLYRLLLQHQDDIFAIRKQNKRKKRAMRTAMGLKLHTSTFFII